MNLFKKSLFALSLVSIASLATINTYALGLITVKHASFFKDENRNVSGFTGISVSTGIDVIITQGTSEKVSVSADNDLLPYVKTEVQNGMLNIYIDKKGHNGWTWNRNVKVYVTAKSLTSITSSSGSDVSSTNAIKSQKLFVKPSSGSDIDLSVETDDLICESSSGSDMKLKGKTRLLNVKSSSGSDISAYDLTAETCVADASSGSDIEVTVTKQLTANASSGGDVSYKGSPQNVVKNESSGGDVNHN